MPVLIFLLSFLIATPSLACAPPKMTGHEYVQQMDSDGNGSVEFEDWRAFYMERDGNFDEEYMRSYFAEFDYDEDGHITYEEYDRNEQEYQQRCAKEMMGIELYEGENHE